LNYERFIHGVAVFAKALGTGTLWVLFLRLEVSKYCQWHFLPGSILHENLLGKVFY